MSNAAHPRHLARLRPRRPRSVAVVLALLTVTLGLFHAPAADPQLGDVNRDDAVNLLDLVVLSNHLQGIAALPESDLSLGDADFDGRLSAGDLDAIADSILGMGAPLGSLPLARLYDTSPRAGEGQVALTRETIFRLTQPLSPATELSGDRLHAEFGGRRILARQELSGDRRTVRLFYLEPLPASARVRVTFDGAGLRDALGRELDLDGDGAAGGVARLEFDTVTLTLVPGTQVAGRVFASELTASGGGPPVNYPLEGVIITVDGQEETLRTVTDGNGNFRLDPAPAGTFFVHIDGRSARNTPQPTQWPEGPYYPIVGKAWVSIPGEEVNLGSIFLPLVSPGTLQPLHPTAPTEVRFPDEVLRRNPELDGVRLDVPPNALFSDSGVRGGRVGIAPVAADRLPSPLPPGLNLPLVITVQTDGASNFDRPVPVCFPNLPDPVTGVTLPAGAKSALWSFNHDLGDWEIVGPMTVSADGRLACSDPGYGILQPGWHGSGQGSQGQGGEIQKVVATTREGEKPGKTLPRGDPGNEIRIPCPEHKNRYVILYRNRKRPAPTEPAVADPVYLFNGEFYHEEIDLHIPGRGFDFVWSRRYRSQFPVSSAMGIQWDFSYNIHLLARGDDFLLQEGTARNDVYLKQPDGSWVSQGLFRRLTREPDGSFTLLFESRNRWSFHPLESAAAGRLRRIEDRNGNAMHFEYDALGRLVRILDTLDRAIRVEYDANGLIQRVTDFAGREIRYEHFETVVRGGGGPGDLKSATTPAVRDSVTGNDFPNGKTRSYTYTSGFEDERLNHNLLSITDGRRNDPSDPTFGQGPYLVNRFSDETDPAAFEFDRIVRQQWGYPGENYDFAYEPIAPSAANGMAVTTATVRDREGHVKEYHFDRDNQLVALAEFTGRSRTDERVDRVSNRPVGRLRVSDPAAFVTRYLYNSDFQLKRLIFPNGNYQENIYESEINPAADARSRGNLRKIRFVPSGGIPGSGAPPADARDIIEETFEYATHLGDCCAGQFVTRHVDGNGHATRYEYDARGNRTRILMAETGAVMDFQYNEFGQLTDEFYPPSGGTRRHDVHRYGTNGPSRGYLIARVVDADHLKLTTAFERDPVGNVIAVTDPKGHRQEAVYNERNQIVRQYSPVMFPESGLRYTVDYHYDANDNLVRIEQLNVDGDGAIGAPRLITTQFEYDILNLVTRVRRPIDALRERVEEFVYDRSRNLALQRFGEATAGRQTNRVQVIEHDERDLLYRTTSAPRDPVQLVVQFDYDANGNFVRRTEAPGDPAARTTTLEYDGHDRRIRIVDPMGNETISRYDRRHNLVGGLVRGELLDQPGSLGNVRLVEEEFTYDRLNRLVRRRFHHFDPATQQPIGPGIADTVFEYDAASLLVKQTDPNGQIITYRYDTVYRPSVHEDARGNGLRFEYDANSNLSAVTRIDRVDGQDQRFPNAYTHDALNRVTSILEPNSGVRRFAYNSRNLRTRVEDPRDGNLTHIRHDALGRIREVRHELNRDGSGLGPKTGEITLLKEYDDDDHLVGQVDGNGNITRFDYDARGHLRRQTYADGASEEWRRNAFGDAIEHVDPNGTRSSVGFDRLGRLVERAITVAAGVDGGVTRQTFAVDGIGNLRRMQDEQSLTEFGYDSQSRRTSETRDGRTVRALYDGAGRLRRTVYPGGRQIDLELDDLGRPERITEGGRTLLAQTFLGLGRVSEMAFGNGTRAVFQHDAAGRIRQLTHETPSRQPLVALAITRDTLNHRTAVEDLLANRLRRLHHDSVGRLVRSENGPLGNRTYDYDAAGNRTLVGGPGVGGPYDLGTPESATRKRNLYAATPAGPLVYDRRGNRLSEAGGAATYTYDFANRLVQYRDASGVVARYAYDPLGRRIEKRVRLASGPETVTRFFHLGQHLLEEQDERGNTLATHVYRGALDSLAHSRLGASDFYFHSDDQGSVRAVTDALGNVIESYDYDDFGTPRITTTTGQSRPESDIGNRHLFQGREFDAESGLYYFRARYLDPRDGRFLTHDPLGIWFDSVNHGNGYTFAGNNPLTLVDPLGLQGSQDAPDDADAGPHYTRTITSQSKDRLPLRPVSPGGTQGSMMRRPLNGAKAGVLDMGGQYLTAGVGSLLGDLIPDELQPNWTASHEHYFTGRYREPGRFGPGTASMQDDYGFGVGGGGVAVTQEKLSEYNMTSDPAPYWDDIMDWARDYIHDQYFDTTRTETRDEAGNIVSVTENYSDKGYGTFLNNCQHYADDLRGWYHHLLGSLCDSSKLTLDNARSRFGDVDIVDVIPPATTTPWYQFW